MIIIKLTSGLGNQLFQYAAARRLAHIHNTELLLDIDSFGQNKLRSYQLKHFNIREKFASPSDVFKLYPAEGLNRMMIRRVLGTRISYKFNNLLEKKHRNNYFTYSNSGHVPPLINGKLLVQRYFHFDNEVLSAPDNLYLMGYFQSEKFFCDIEGIIRKDFVLKNEVSGRNKEYLLAVQATQSVSLHVRRGDYVNDPETKKLFNICNAGYYNKAIQMMYEFTGKPHFFVFSDDLLWVKENLEIKFPVTFVDCNTDNAIEDMRLMWSCKHNIIANSSFSWWAAWLNNNADKKVIAPSRWINQKNYNMNDIVPESWIRI